MLQWLWDTRKINLLAFLMSILGLSIAVLYFQNHLALPPCPLCIFQRIGLFGAALVALAAGIHNPGDKGLRIYSSVGLIFTLFGLAITLRHLWIQNLPPDQVPACGPDLGYMLQAFPLADVIRTVLNGSGECAEVQWTFLNLSIPGWVLVVFIIFFIFQLAQLWKGNFTGKWRPSTWQ